MIDFEQLKINNVDLNEKIEERNDDILKLKKKVTSTVEVLTHVKEKLQFLQVSKNNQFHEVVIVFLIKGRECREEGGTKRSGYDCGNGNLCGHCHDTRLIVHCCLETRSPDAHEESERFSTSRQLEATAEGRVSGSYCSAERL